MNFSKTVPFFLIVLFFSHCKNNNSPKNILIAPENWRSEVIQFPLEFAPSLEYSGIEYIQFAPGWGENTKKDYFSYVLLWEIDQNPKLSAKKLESEMETYFDGLMSAVSKTDLKLFKEQSKSKAFFEKINDTKYVGKVLTYDAFMTKEQVSLNMIVEYSFCSIQNKHLVLFNVSPQAPEHPVWKKMKKVTIDLECE